MTATAERGAAGGTPVVHALLDTLVAWDVRRVFCCPGSTEAAFLDSLVTRDDVELVLVTHESVAVSMAEGMARMTGRPAVAYLHTSAQPVNRGIRHSPHSRPAGDAVEAAARVLREARRPVLVAGAEVARHGATDALVTLAERLGAPVVHEDRRDFVRTAFPGSHPHYVGMYQPTHDAVADADAVFFAGARLFTEFDLPTPGGRPDIPPEATVLHAHGDPEEVGRLHSVTDLLGALPAGPGDTARVSALRRRWTDRHAAEPTHSFPAHTGLGPVARALAEGRFGGAAARDGQWPGTDITGPDITAIAAGFGLEARRIVGAAGLTDAVQAAQRSPRPQLLEVITAPRTPEPT